MIVSVGIGALVNLIGNAILIPQFAEMGATIASIVSEIIVMFVYIYLGKKYFSLQGIITTSIKVFCAAALVVLYLFTCSMLPVNSWVILIIQAIGEITIYFIILIICKEDVVVEYTQTLIRKVKTMIHHC